MASNSFLDAGPPMFIGENYHIWVIKMTYLKALPLLGPNPTVAQIKNYEDAKFKNQGTHVSLFSTFRCDFHKNNGL